MDSILGYVKKNIGDSIDNTDFDLDIISNINASFAILFQLGLGPKEGFFISGKEECWSDFMDQSYILEMVKQYIYLKSKIVFDPPSNSFLVENINKRILELESRLNMYEGGVIV